MARLEKHRAYREQIKNEGELQNALNEATPLIKEFKKELDAINPKILSQYKKKNIELTELLIIDESKRTNINAIQTFVDEFNFSELLSMRERAEIFVNSEKNKFAGFEEGWLDKDAGIVAINACNNMFNRVQKENIAFDQTSQSDFKKFKEIESIARRAKADPSLNQTLEIPPAKRTTSLYIPFFVSIGIFAVAIIAFIAIIIVMSVPA